MNIYIAASFACDSREETERRKQAIKKMTNRLRGLMPPTANFYVPHELQILHAWEMTMTDWATAVYEADMAALTKADVVIFLSFGKNNNAGSAWECGFASGRGIPVVMIRMTNSTESVMLFGSARAIIDEDAVERYEWWSLPHYITPSLCDSKYILS